LNAVPRRVYLSGGMEYAANEGRDWRETMQRFCEDELGWTVFNPNRESERFFQKNWPGMDFRAVKRLDIDRYREIVSRLVDIDSHEIAERTDIVVCYWDEAAAKGAGTKGELTMARFFGKPVYMVTSIPAQEIPGWVLGCTTRMFAAFSALTEFLRSTHLAATGKAEESF
jgi:hypothetical protein